MCVGGGGRRGGGVRKTVRGPSRFVGVLGRGYSRCLSIHQIIVVDPWHVPIPCYWLTDPDPAFSSVSCKMPARNKFFSSNFFAYYFINVHFHQFSSTKYHKRSHKIVEIMVFLTFFCLLMEGSGSVQNYDGSGRPKNIRSGSTTLRQMIRYLTHEQKNCLEPR